MHESHGDFLDELTTQLLTFYISIIQYLIHNIEPTPEKIELNNLKL